MRLLAFGLFTIIAAGCSAGADSAVGATNPTVEQAAAVPLALANIEVSSEGAEARASIAADPARIPGSFSDVNEGLIVVSSVLDPLNVRVQPGVSHEVVTQLPHRTSGVATSHSVTLESRATWSLVSVDGEVLGWVNGDYLRADTR